MSKRTLNFFLLIAFVLITVFMMASNLTIGTPAYRMCKRAFPHDDALAAQCEIREHHRTQEMEK